MQDYGSTIRGHRKKQGLTQEQLGRMVVVGKKKVDDWENNRSTPNLMQIPLLCSALGISYNTFFGCAKRQKPPRHGYHQMSIRPALSNLAIHSMREARKMSAAELAAILGKTEELILRWESGTAIPKLYDIPPLCEALGMSFKQFFE